MSQKLQTKLNCYSKNNFVNYSDVLCYRRDNSVLFYKSEFTL